MMNRLLTVEEVATLLRLSPRGVYNLVAARRIPHIKVGTRVRFKVEQVEEWLAEKTVDEVKPT